MKVMRNCILLVDDNAAVRRALRRVFEDAGWEVCGEADSGCDAILKAKQLQPQVILLDLAMPQMDGLVAGRILKRGFAGSTPNFVHSAWRLGSGR